MTVVWLKENSIISPRIIHFYEPANVFRFFFCFVLMVYYILEAEHKLLLKSLLIATPQK